MGNILSFLRALDNIHRSVIRTCLELQYQQGRIAEKRKCPCFIIMIANTVCFFTSRISTHNTSIGIIDKQLIQGMNVTTFLQDQQAAGFTDPVSFLRQQYRIENRCSSDGNLVLLNYPQVAPKGVPEDFPLYRECRQLVLDTKSWQPIARSFDRFFDWKDSKENQMQMQMEIKSRDGSEVSFREKVDGSILLLFATASVTRASSATEALALPLCTGGQEEVTNGSSSSLQWRWQLCTRSTFCEGNAAGWEHLFLRAVGARSVHEFAERSSLDPMVSYVMELCTRDNRVIRDYGEADQIYLIGARRRARSAPGASPDENNDDWYDYSELELDTMAKSMMVVVVNVASAQEVKRTVLRPAAYPELKTIADAQRFLAQKETEDPTFEGLVLRVGTFRAKLKTKTWLEAHRNATLQEECKGGERGTGRAHLSDTTIVARYLEGKIQAATVPARQSLFLAVDQVLAELIQEFEDLQHTYSADTKGFAAAVAQHPLKSVLFELRKVDRTNQQLCKTLVLKSIKPFYQRVAQRLRVAETKETCKE